MPCVFCQIAAGESSAEKILENDDVLAFLDSRPLFPGHCLLIPKTHYETLAELPAALVPKVFEAAQRLSRAVEDALKAEGSFIGINNRVSQSVPHLHVHVVPRRKKDGLRGFFWPRNAYKDQQQMQEVAESLRSALRNA